ncbi:MAG: YggT family protein [Gemmatimonadales bacterium]
MAELRAAILVAALLALTVALTNWAVRRGRLRPFGPWARFIRRGSDPLLHPIERRLAAAGGNPVTAPWWLLGLVALGGLAFLSLVQWVVDAVYTLRFAVASGPIGIIALLVTTAYDILIVALLVRVVGAWFGVGRWTRWMRPAYQLTDWLVAPLARLIPTIGIFDVSPIAAWFILWVVRGLLLGLLARL